MSPDGAWIGYSLTTDSTSSGQTGPAVYLLSDERLRLVGGRRAHRVHPWDDLAIANADGSDVRFVTRTQYALEGGAHVPDGAKLLQQLRHGSMRVQGPGDHIYRRRERRAQVTGVPRSPRASNRQPSFWRPAAPPVRNLRPRANPRHADADDLVGTPKADLILARAETTPSTDAAATTSSSGDVPLLEGIREYRDRLFGGPGRDFVELVL